MGLKLKLFIFALGDITKEMLERKHKMHKKRLVAATALAAGVAVIPVSGVDVAVNVALLVHGVRHYMRVFGVESERVNTLEDFHHVLLKCRSLLEPNFDTTLFVCTPLGAHGTLLLSISLFDLILPLGRPVLSSATASSVTYRFLSDMLLDINDDAMQIHEHVMKTNADHRM